MLISHTWLKEKINDQNIVIVDTRPKIAYSYGHIPNAVSLVVDQLIQISPAGAHLAPDPQKASQLLGELGIDNSKIIVVSGELMDPSVFRVAWTLQYLGQQNTKILDVGIGTWQSLGLEMTRAQKKPTPVQFVPQIQESIRIQAEELRGLLGKAVILDARTPQEYFGGHIPGSVLFPFTDGIGQDGLLLDSKSSLEELFLQKQIPKDKEIICYCMHGHRASSLFYQAKIAGFDKVRLYDGSFIDWYSRRLALE
ncbi:MAG: rhodanese-like domain-containing protein [Candidatus Nitrosotenuis sp.]|jgi:thiosulfate/3-mercaptopyruvate sulfurtransferase